MKSEIWTIRNGAQVRKIRVEGAMQHIWNVVNVHVSARVAKRLGELDGWKADIRHAPRVVFTVVRA